MSPPAPLSPKTDFPSLTPPLKCRGTFLMASSMLTAKAGRASSWTSIMGEVSATNLEGSGGGREKLVGPILFLENCPGTGLSFL